MPIVKTKKEIKSLLLEVQSTNSGFTVDMKAWATSEGHSYLGTEKEEENFKALY